jgi:hypothetical protein
MFISENNKNFAALSSENKNSYGFSQTRTLSSAKNWPCLFINTLKLGLTGINKELEW